MRLDIDVDRQSPPLAFADTAKAGIYGGLLDPDHVEHLRRLMMNSLPSARLLHQGEAEGEHGFIDPP